MDGELALINKYLKKHLSFIIEVWNYELRGKSTNTSQRLDLHVYVSPSHFCELFFNHKTEMEVNKIIKEEFHNMIKTIFTDWDGYLLNLIYHPKYEETIMNIINKESPYLYNYES